MERELSYEQLNDEYSMLMSAMNVSVSRHLVDEHFTVVWANDYYYELIGYPKEEYERLFHNHCDEYFRDNQKSWEIIHERLHQMLAGGRNNCEMFLPMLHPDGSTFWVKLVGFFRNEYLDGKQLAYITMSDVTELMETQRERMVAYDSIPGFIVKYRVMPDRLVLLNASESLMNMFGVDAEHVSSFDPLSVIDPKERDVLIERLPGLRRGEPFNGTVHARDKEGRTRWFQVNFTCIDSMGNDPIYLAVHIDVTDITEMRELQSKLEERTKLLNAALGAARSANRAKSEFLSRMSHDIRTPMNAIVGMAEIADAHRTEPERVRDCMQKIRLSSRHLLGLINDVLDMSKIESGNIIISEDAVSLAEILREVFGIMRPNFQQRDQRFDAHLDGLRHEEFVGDALRLRQIFINLLSNASKFTPERGRIAFAVRELPSDQPGKAVFCFTVEDNGIGMEPEFLTHIFDAFVRERDSRIDRTEGSGLGMAITKNLVEQMGGGIEVESRPGTGTRFCVTLPVRIREKQEESAFFPNARVLLADGDPVVLRAGEQTFRSLCAAADCADSGPSAVARALEAHRRGKDYAIAILDRKLPETGGLRAAVEIRKELGEDAPLLLMSDCGADGLEREETACGVRGLIEKPFFYSTARGCLQKYLTGEEKAEEKAEEYNFRGKRFLLAEDNEINREIAVEMLGNLGAKVEIACDGVEAVERFRSAPAGHFDLILMDIQMPVMNGREAAKTIRALPGQDARSVPILAMTADAFAEDIRAAEAAGMNGHLAKPLDFSAMNREISRWIKKGGGGNQN